MTIGAVSFQTFWTNHLQNGGGCFTDAFIENYLEVVLDKKEDPKNRLEVLCSFLSTPMGKIDYVLSLLRLIKFDNDDPAFGALSMELSWIIRCLESNPEA